MRIMSSDLRWLFICAMCTVVSAIGQDTESISWNDRAIQLAKQQEEPWEVIYHFEHARRSSPAEARTATTNVTMYRADADLPEHTWLHFGWRHGIGQWAHNWPTNFWLLLSVLWLVWAGYLVFKYHWKHGRWIVVMTIFALISLVLAVCRHSFLKSKSLVIIKGDTPLYQRPYDGTDTIQILYSGQMATLLSGDEGFVQIETDTYEKGWIKSDQAQSLHRK